MKTELINNIIVTMQNKLSDDQLNQLKSALEFHLYNKKILQEKLYMELNAPNNNPRPFRGRVEKEMPNRIKDLIRGVSEVRLVGDNVEQGIYSFREAMRIADDLNLDLVEVSPNSAPPVCRILDYQKFLYQKKRKEKEIKANSAKIEVKELRFGPQTDEHDYNFKLKHAQEFLKAGNKVKAYVFYRGRSIVFKEQGELLLARFAADLADFCRYAGSIAVSHSGICPLETVPVLSELVLLSECVEWEVEHGDERQLVLEHVV